MKRAEFARSIVEIPSLLKAKPKIEKFQGFSHTLVALGSETQRISQYINF